MTQVQIHRLYLIGYASVLIGTVLIPISNWIGGTLFFGAVALIILTTLISIHGPRSH